MTTPPPSASSTRADPPAAHRRRHPEGAAASSPSASRRCAPTRGALHVGLRRRRAPHARASGPPGRSSRSRSRLMRWPPPCDGSSTLPRHPTAPREPHQAPGLASLGGPWTRSTSPRHPAVLRPHRGSSSWPCGCAASRAHTASRTPSLEPVVRHGPAGARTVLQELSRSCPTAWLWGARPGDVRGIPRVGRPDGSWLVLGGGPRHYALPPGQSPRRLPLGGARRAPPERGVQPVGGPAAALAGEHHLRPSSTCPLAVLGFPPVMYLGGCGRSTRSTSSGSTRERWGKLGPVEWVNEHPQATTGSTTGSIRSTWTETTRASSSSGTACFGTYEARGLASPFYGTVKAVPTWNPLSRPTAAPGFISGICRASRTCRLCGQGARMAPCLRSGDRPTSAGR